jgi:hypothetical protein
VDGAARLVRKLYVPADRQSRIASLQRWFRWLDERGAIEEETLPAF